MPCNLQWVVALLPYKQTTLKSHAIPWYTSQTISRPKSCSLLGSLLLPGTAYLIPEQLGGH